MARIVSYYQRGFWGLRNPYYSVRIGRELSSYRTKTLRDDAIEFDTTQRIFHSKKLSEIIRSLAILKVSSYDIFVKNSLPLMNFTEKLIGKWMFNSLMKKTMYIQFVAGEEYDDIQESISHLQEHGIGTILCVPTEEDFVQDTDQLESKEQLFDRNTEVLHECIEKTVPGAFAQMRITALCSPSVLTNLSILLKPYETEVEKPNGLDINNLARGFDADKHHLDLVPELSASKNKHLQNSLRRMDALAKHSKDRNVSLLLDAEQSYMEGAIHQMVLTLQSKYNRHIPWVYHTYQAYRKDTLDRLKADLQLMSSEGFHFAAKIVRGAYKDTERKRAKELGYEDPIHDTYEDTCNTYNNSIAMILDKVAQTPAKVMVATHNEESVKLATKRMVDLGIDKREGKVSFAQVYGMGDQITYLLGAKGYEIYKSVPYGPVNTTLAYLARRAAENKDVAQRTEKERSLMWKELSYRLFSSQKEEYKLSQERK